MKKTYETPSVEIVKFQYRDQVVAASGVSCTKVWINLDPNHAGACIEDNSHYGWSGNQSL